jgi:hypothetical protein
LSTKRDFKNYFRKVHLFVQGAAHAIPESEPADAQIAFQIETHELFKADVWG